MNVNERVWSLCDKASKKAVKRIGAKNGRLYAVNGKRINTEKPGQNCKSGMLKCTSTVSTMKGIFYKNFSY